MNICLLNDSFPPIIDGVANVVMNYASVMTNELNSNVVVGTPRYPDVNYDGYPYRVVAYPSINTQEFIQGYRTGNPLSIREIAQLANPTPDIIHTHCPAASTIMARILRHETGTPVIFTYHTKFDVDIARAVGEGFIKNETIRVMISNIEACDDVWVVSEGAGENLRSLGYEGELRVMPNGVDFPKGRVDEAKVKEITASYDLPEGIPVFLFVGRLMKYKGLPIIIEAMSMLAKKGMDFRMVFVGGGGDVIEMQEMVKKAGISLDIYNEEQELTHFDAASGNTGKVIFVGPIHDREKLRAWNTRADLFLFPSVYDTNGIVVREAAACGLGSVLIKGSCAAEGITDGRNGYLIEESPEAMAALLEEIGGNLQGLHDVGQHAMDEIYISWENAVRLAYDRYKELHEMAKSGELGIRKHQSFEYLMNSAAVVMNGTKKAFVDNPRQFYGGMRENFQEFKDNVTEFKNEFRESVTDITNEFKENVTDITNEFKENVTDFGNEIKNGINGSFEKFKDNISEGIDKLNDDLRN